MASSEVAICNLALGRIGISIFISSLTEVSNEARVCSVFYEPCRDMVLQDFPWNFASKHSALANLGTPPTNWLFRYQLPSDCLEARYIVLPGNRQPRSGQRIAYEVSVENDVKVLYTDQENAELVYTTRVTNPNLFSPLFVMALGWLIGAEAAMPLTAAPRLGDAARRNYALAISAAGSASLREQEAGPEPDSEFITARL
jgi:hypothetical protein